MIFMVHYGSRLIFYGSRWVFMVFHGSRFVFFIFHIENPLKLYSGPTIQSRPCQPWAGFGLVLQKFDLLLCVHSTINLF